MNCVALDIHYQEWLMLFQMYPLGSTASFTPPAFPRPPTFTCALTTTLLPIFAAASCARSGVVEQQLLEETGTACFFKKIACLVFVEIHVGSLE
jgi:hypothetical protein